MKSQDGVTQIISIVDTPGYDPNSAESMQKWFETVKGELERRVDYSIIHRWKKRGKASANLLFLGESTRDLEEKIHAAIVMLGSENSPREGEYFAKLAKYVGLIPVLAKGDQLDPVGVKLSKEGIMRMARHSSFEWLDIRQVNKYKNIDS